MSDRATRAQEREDRRNRRLSFLSTSGTPLFRRQNPPPPPPRTPVPMGPRPSPASSVSNPPPIGSFNTPVASIHSPSDAPGLEPHSLTHIITNIFGHPEDGVMAQALAHTGVLSFVDLLALKERDIDNMTYPVDSLPDENGDPQPDELRPLPFNMKAILRGFVGFIPYRAKKLLRPITVYNCMEELDCLEFNTFRTSPDFAYFNNSTNGEPIVPSPVRGTQTRTPAEEFNKSFKLHPTYFPTLSEDKGYDQFERELTAIANSHGLLNVLDPTYKPVTPHQIELFDHQR